MDTQRFGDWLARHGQTERSRRVLWDLFCVSALNIAGDDASLALAAVVVKTGLLGKNNAADIGVPALPLGELHGDAGATLLAKLGARVSLGAKVDRDRAGSRTAAVPRPAGGRATRDRRRGGPGRPAREGRAADAAGRAARADRRGLGRPRRLAHRQRARDLRPAGAWTCRSWPPSTPRCSGSSTAPASPGLPTGPGHQYLAISLSAADQYADTPVAELQEQFVPALAELFPAARDAKVAEFFVTRERRATFRQAPGSGALRPKAATRRPGLVLAGAWTDTGWPDTMEGAVRSGLAAAVELRRTVAQTRLNDWGTSVTAVMPEGVALARDLVGPRDGGRDRPAHPGRARRRGVPSRLRRRRGQPDRAAAAARRCGPRWPCCPPAPRARRPSAA